MNQALQEIVRIAVVGHRSITVRQNLTDAVHEVIETILRSHPGQEMWLYSALAEGGDQLAAMLAEEYHEVKLVVPLPLPLEEYLADFETAEGITQFSRLLRSATSVIEMPLKTDHKAAYRQLGDYLVEQCDALIALWDGDEPEREGGTAEVVQKALAAGKPVYWIYCENHHSVKAEANVASPRIGEIQLLGLD